MNIQLKFRLFVLKVICKPNHIPLRFSIKAQAGAHRKTITDYLPHLRKNWI